MAVQITKKKAAPVQPVAQDEVLDEVGLAEPKGGVTITRRPSIHIGSKVKIVNKQHEWVAYYQIGDTGEVTRFWPATKEAINLNLGKRELDIYEVALDNPRSIDHERVLVLRHELDTA
jgi:hypothetical protein